MNEMTCSGLDDIATELALDVLDAEDRARALAHLDTCARCRQEVAQLTDAGQELLRLAPAVRPSAGFEQRVLERIASTPETASITVLRERRSRRARARRLLAAAAIVVAIVTGAAVLANRPGDDTTAVRTAAMRTGASQVVGRASVSGDPAVVSLDIPDWAALVRSYGGAVDAHYWVEVSTANGTRALYRLPAVEDQPWRVPTHADGQHVVSVSVVDARGRVWCTARLA
jgi:anti-sigma factor RsiW